MDLSVVIPAFNEEKLLPHTLAALREALVAIGGAGWTHETVVCDNNSSDQTPRIAAAHGARVVFEPINQISRARNSGAREATGRWLMFLDADSCPSSALLREMHGLMSSGDVIGGGATVALDDSVRWARVVAVGWNVLSRWKLYAAGSFIFCEAEAFRGVGGFSDRLFASEEVDFSVRLRRYGKVRGKRMVIMHRHPLRTSARKMHLYSKWELLAFLGKLAISGGRSLHRADGCSVWYDGRR